MSYRSAFVTGGTGFVGSHLAEELVRRGYRVRCLVRSDPKWLRGADVEIVRGSLDNEQALRDGVAGVDAVFHVAGLTRASDTEEFGRSNVAGTVRLLEAVRRTNPDVAKVLITSSLAVVGAAPVPVATESTPLNPISRYGMSKAKMESALEGDGTAPSWFDQLPIVVVRPPAVYGPREKDIFLFFKSVSRGVCPIIGSGGSPEISLVYVADLVRGMVDAAESPATAGQTYFIGSEEFYSWNRIRDVAVGAIDRRVVTVRVPRGVVPAVATMAEWVGRLTRNYPALNKEKADEILNACKMCSVEKAMRDFGFRQKTPVQEGFETTIEWYRREGWLK